MSFISVWMLPSKKTAGTEITHFWNREKVSWICCLHRNESQHERPLLWFGFIDHFFMWLCSVLFFHLWQNHSRMSLLYRQSVKWTDFVVWRLRARQLFIPSMFGFFSQCDVFPLFLYRSQMKASLYHWKVFTSNNLFCFLFLSETKF